MTFRYLLGLDPGFASLGWAVLRLGKTSVEVQSMGTFETEKSDKKRKVLASDDNVRRAMLIARELHHLMSTHQPVAICAEAMSFPRNSSAAAKMAMTWGSIATFSEQYRVPILQLGPKAVKLAITGDAQASKDDVIAAVRSIYPETKRHADNVPKGFTKIQWRATQEHCHDAVAAAHAMLDSVEIRLVRQMM